MTLRQKTTEFLETAVVRNSIICVILFNAVLLGLESSITVMNFAGSLINKLDIICLSIFVLEILAKLFTQHFRFFRSGWNIFDFVIVGIA
ncbi:MAG: voltage-gated sodium channel, partial [Alteromonas macleodii]